MNLENIDLLSQKVERVLEVLRVLKAEKAQLQSKVDSFESVLAQKDDEIAVLKSSLEERSVELTTLNDTVKSQEDEIQLAQERFQQLLSTIEAELGTEISIAPSEQDSSSVPNEQQEEAPQSDFFS
jgi:predicted  nucleic acid-binding Zn-ribbon protein